MLMPALLSLLISLSPPPFLPRGDDGAGVGDDGAVDGDGDRAAGWQSGDDADESPEIPQDDPSGVTTFAYTVDRKKRQVGCLGCAILRLDPTPGRVIVSSSMRFAVCTFFFFFFFFFGVLVRHTTPL